MRAKEKMQLVSTVSELTARVDEVRISDVTRNLIKCRAMLSNLFSHVVSSYYQVFPDADDLDDTKLDNFKNLWGKLDHEVARLTGDVIEVNLNDTDYKEL
ncbi:hypothetical protein [Hallella bergensis]|uniref:hypothetical protein n=1 Tax=Hallella bergensis TaxID=242750 RepID=UPI0023F0EB7F|nr:hypothetical protein [Hallella bergensis]